MSIAGGSLPASAADTPLALFAPRSDNPAAIATIPDGYFEPVTLNVRALFAMPANTRHDLVLPHLGRLAIAHDHTRTIASGGRVTRWEGHVAGRQDLKLSFVKGRSGMVSGVIDTPAGRVLLGQAGGYIVYKPSRALPAQRPADSNAPPEALLQPADHDTATPAVKPAAVAYPVVFNSAVLSSIPLGDEVNLSLPGAGTFRVVHDNTLAGDLGATTFVGYLKEYGDDYRMMVTVSPGAAQGQIQTPYGLYLIKTIGQRQWLIDVRGSDLHPLIPAENDGIDQATAATAPGAPVRSDAASISGTPAIPAASTALADTGAADKTRIDVLILYTPGLEKAYGGTAQVWAELQNLLALANQAYVDSGVEIVLRLVGAVKVDAPDDTPSMDALNALTAGTGPYGNVAWLRDTYGADLVSLVRPFSTAQGGLCGNAWVAGSNGTAVASFRNHAYSVLGDGQDGRYYCPGYTLAHELGHNMGSAHDRATVEQQGGSSGAYPYSFGYGVSGQFGTIMSYIDPVVGKFSNPSILCKDQLPCGISETDTANSANNALTLNNTRLAVAAFTTETAVLGASSSIAGVITVQGQGLSGVELRPSSGGKCSPSGGSGSYACIVPSGWSGTVTPVLTGYSFTPESLSLNDLSDNIINQDFTALQGGNSIGISGADAKSNGGGGGGTVDAGLLMLMALSGGLRLAYGKGASARWRAAMKCCNLPPPVDKH